MCFLSARVRTERVRFSVGVAGGFFRFFQGLLNLPALQGSLSFFLFFPLLGGYRRVSFSLRAVERGAGHLFGFQVLTFYRLQRSVYGSFMAFRLASLGFQMFLGRVFGHLFVLFQ